MIHAEILVSRHWKRRQARESKEFIHATNVQQCTTFIWLLSKIFMFLVWLKRQPPKAPRRCQSALETCDTLPYINLRKPYHTTEKQSFNFTSVRSSSVALKSVHHTPPRTSWLHVIWTLQTGNLCANQLLMHSLSLPNLYYAARLVGGRIKDSTRSICPSASVSLPYVPCRLLSRER